MKYDATLKELLLAGAPGLWRVLGLQQPNEILTVEFPSVHVRRPDFVARFDKGTIVHKVDDPVGHQRRRTVSARGGTQYGNLTRYS